MKYGKKKLALTLALPIVLSMAMSLSACEKEPGTSSTTASNTSSGVQQECVQHTEQVIPGVAATCTEKGLTDGKKCSVCGEVLTAQEEIPALGHAEVTDEAVAATCTVNGKTEGKHCSRCNEVFTAQESIDALGHDWGEWVETKAATTEAAGEEERNCNRAGCEGKETREIPKLSANEPNGHVWDEGTVIKEATCTEDGSKIFKCTNEGCSATKDETMNVLGHDKVTDEAVAPTCTSDGKTEGVHCERCKVVLQAQETVQALGHLEVVDEAVSANCGQPGKTEGKHCSRCNEVFVAQTEIAATGAHSYGEWAVTKEPTYKEEGEKTRTCSVCNQIETETVEMLKMFTEEQKGTYICTYVNVERKKQTIAETRLVINSDDTVTILKDDEYSATNSEVTVQKIWNNLEEVIGYTFGMYNDLDKYEDTGKFYFQDGILWLNLTGTYIPMIKENGKPEFTAAQQGVYSGKDKYEFDYELTIGDDGAVSLNYSYQDAETMKTVDVSVEKLVVYQLGDGYVFICNSGIPGVFTLQFTENGDVEITVSGQYLKEDPFTLSRA